MGTPVQADEVYIHDTYFPIVGPVRRTNFAVTPNPVLFGDTSKAGDAIALTQLTQTDYNGGSGVHLGNVRTDTNRVWTSDLATHHHKAVTLPPLATDLGKPSWAAASAIPRFMVEYDNKLFVCFDNKLGYWTDASGWAGAADRTLLGNGRAAVVWNNLLYVVSVGTTPEVRDVAGAWAAVVGAVSANGWQDIAVWDDKLWVVATFSTPGQLGLAYSIDGTNWAVPAIKNAMNPRGNTARLGVYRDSTGASALYVHLDTGLYIWDMTFQRLKPTESSYSPVKLGYDQLLHVQGPDGRFYITNGKLGLVGVQTGNPMVLTPMGLDRDDGYPLGEDGAITGLVADENFVYALMFGSNEISLRGYRGGWHKLYKDTDANPLMTANGTSNYTPMLVTTLSSNKRLFFAYNGNLVSGQPKIFSIQLPTGIINPRFIGEPGGYAAGPLDLVTPWWPIESEVQRKIFGHLFVQARNHTANETTEIFYEVDLSESLWLGVLPVYGATNPIVSDGLKEFYANIAGQQVQWIRYMFRQRRGGTATLTPIVEFYTAEFMRILGPTYAYSVEIDLTKSWRRKSPEQLRKRIEDLIDPGVVTGWYKFSWQDELEGVRTHYGRISRESGMGFSGPGLRGQGRETLSIIVPYNRDVV